MPSNPRDLIAEAQATHWTTLGTMLGPYCARCRQLYPCAALRLVDALKASLTDTERLEWLAARAIPESGLHWLEIGPWTNDQTFREYLDAARKGQP